MEKIKRPLFIFFGYLFFALGLIGVLLPVIPTTPFILLAAYFFSKGSPKIYAWLTSLPRFGQAIKDYTEYGVIKQSAKFSCAITVVAVNLYIWLFLLIALWAKICASTVLVIVVAYVVSRPSDKREKS